MQSVKLHFQRSKYRISFLAWKWSSKSSALPKVERLLAPNGTKHDSASHRASARCPLRILPFEKALRKHDSLTNTNTQLTEAVPPSDRNHHHSRRSLDQFSCRSLHTPYVLLALAGTSWTDGRVDLSSRAHAVFRNPGYST